MPARHAIPARGLVALGLVLLATAAPADPPLRLSPQVIQLVRGLICAPPEAGRRDAPDTASGWIHVPDEPVHIRIESTIAPALLGTGFGVRYILSGVDPVMVRYQVDHPPMPPSGITRQGWDSIVLPGLPEQVFFQFDVEDERLPGDWSFSAFADGVELFHAGFAVVEPESVPHLTGLCPAPPLLALSR